MIKWLTAERSAPVFIPDSILPDQFFARRTDKTPEVRLWTAVLIDALCQYRAKPKRRFEVKSWVEYPERTGGQRCAGCFECVCDAISTEKDPVDSGAMRTKLLAWFKSVDALPPPEKQPRRSWRRSVTTYSLKQTPRGAYRSRNGSEENAFSNSEKLKGGLGEKEPGEA